MPLLFLIAIVALMLTGCTAPQVTENDQYKWRWQTTAAKLPGDLEYPSHQRKSEAEKNLRPCASTATTFEAPAKKPQANGNLIQVNETEEEAPVKWIAASCWL
jgi:hypothetical protein